MADLRSRLAALDDIEVPDLWPEIERRTATDAPRSVSARVGWHKTTTQPARSSHPMITSTRVAAAAAIVAVLSGALFLGNLSLPSPGPGGALASEAPSTTLAWDSGLVRLSAAAMRIREGDRVFTGETVESWAVHSDPGDSDYRTLEIEWREQDLEQRLYLYFAADETDWWVSELRTRDGLPEADWITYTGPFFRTPLGEGFRGDVRLTSQDGRAPGVLEFDDMTLTYEAVFGGAAQRADSTAKESDLELLVSDDPTEGPGFDPKPDATRR